jgi:dihydrofolate reductase
VIAIVVAHSANGVIGRGGALPWRLPTDLRRFRELTVGHTVVMGRRTFESLPPAYRPLPDRRNMVLSGAPGYEADGAEVFSDLEQALDESPDGCFVIGGEVTYRQALPLAQRVYATEVDAEVEGDAFFPALSASEWRRVERSERIVEGDYGYNFCVYDRAS